MSLPEVVYGNNHFYLVNESRGLLYEFSPVEALKLINFEVVKDSHTDKMDSIVDNMANMSLQQCEEKLLNLIDVIPEQIKIAEAKYWKGKDFSKVKDFKNVEIISDWTFSTPYKGNVRYIHNHIDRIKNETNLVLSSGIDKDAAEITVTPSEEGIPYDRLTPQNPIVEFGDLYLFEDD